MAPSYEVIGEGNHYDEEEWSDVGAVELVGFFVILIKTKKIFNVKYN